MTADRLGRWLKQAMGTQDEEISCSECFDLVSRFVDLQLTGKDATRTMPQVSQHLGQCPACQEEYAALVDIRRLEDEGRLPSLEELRRSTR